MNYIIGYGIVFTYLLFLIFVVGEIVRRLFDVELSRKVIHICTFFVLPIFDYFVGPSIHFIIMCVMFLGVTAGSYFLKILKPIEREKNKNPGTIYYALSLLLLSTLTYFFHDLYPYMFFGFGALAFGDGLASVIGLAFKGPKIYKNKTFNGFLACLLASFVTLVMISRGYLLSFSPFALFALAIFIAIIELVDLGLDNLLIPILTFFIMFGIAKLGTNFVIALCIFDTVFLLAYLLKVMTYYGALLGALTGACFYYFTGVYGLIFVLGLYIVLLVVHVIRKKKQIKDDVTKKIGPKDVIQVLANGSISIIYLLLGQFLSEKMFIVMAFIIMLSGFADSIASDIGSMSKGQAFDLFKGKKTQMGLSGGITLLGTVSMILFTGVFAYLITLINGISYIYSFIIFGFVVFAQIVDTMLGSLFQAKYKCSDCGILLEKEIHHDKPTILVSGFKWMNNDLVNLISSVAVGLLSLTLLVISL